MSIKDEIKKINDDADAIKAAREELMADLDSVDTTPARDAAKRAIRDAVAASYGLYSITPASAKFECLRVSFGLLCLAGQLIDEDGFNCDRVANELRQFADSLERCYDH